MQETVFLVFSTNIKTWLDVRQRGDSRDEEGLRGCVQMEKSCSRVAASLIYIGTKSFQKKNESWLVGLGSLSKA